jgi:hypothetical protein
MALHVIGTGFGRTGTDSMREALTILGFGPCHHMLEINQHEAQRQRWRALALGAAPDWQSLFEGYRSCVDWPSAFYWRQLIAAYPVAKVILTYRSSESWWQSFEKTILVGIGKETDPHSLAHTLIEKQVFDSRPADRAHAIAAYEANVHDVLATVPRDRLLVHNLGDGWEPLCHHLGVAVPDAPYPSRNSASSFKDTFLQQ